MGDHTETLKVEFNPAIVSLKDLLDVFWKSHNPTRVPWSRQYMSIFFYDNDEQKEIIMNSKREFAEKIGKKIFTEVVKLDVFYPAEDYHQKYYLQKVPALMEELRTFYPDFQDFIKSTAVARINGYVAGFGNLDMLLEEIDDFGLSTNNRKLLLEIIKKSANAYY